MPKIELLTIAEAAERLGISVRVLQRIVARGDLRPALMPRRIAGPACATTGTPPEVLMIGR